MREGRPAADFSQDFRNFISRCESSLFPPAADLAMVVITREDFEEAIGRMKGKVDEMEGPNEENLENIRIPIDRHFTWKFFDMDIDEEDACLLDKKYRKNSPVRYRNEVRMKFWNRETATFAEHWKGSIREVLEDYPAPVVIVAHNGLHHDFRVLFGEMLRYGFLEEGLPKDLYFVDSLLGFMNVEEKFLKEINEKLANLESEETQHPWTKIRQEEGTIALKKRFQKSHFTEYTDGNWKVSVYRYEKDRFVLPNLYRMIIGGERAFHQFQEDAKALLQVSMSYGKKFLDYVEEAAASFPF